jgi:hypothetical protein
LPLVGGAALTAALLLNVFPLLRPQLLQDDLQILARSVTWQSTAQNLLHPHNEHLMPPGRVTTRLLIALAGRPTALPLGTSLQGVLALLLGMLLVYFFVRRELNHPLYGVVAMALFGVSSVYQQAVFWFSASFSVLALDTLLLALLAAQRWRQTGRFRHLTACALLCGLAPLWFATGVLTGPLCTLYLLGAERRRGLGWAAVPLLGSAAFLLVRLPPLTDHLLRLEPGQRRDVAGVFELLTGLEYTARSLVENLALGVLGIGGIDLPAAVIVPALLGLMAAAAWWWRGAPGPLPLLGAGMVLGSYVLVYGSRGGEYSYTGVMNQPNWGRYHLLPQLGLALFLCGGLPRWGGRWQLDPAGSLSARQTRRLLLLIAALFLIQLPRAVAVNGPHTLSPAEQFARLRDDPAGWLRWAWEEWWHDPEREAQLAVLRRIEEVDARCRRHRIAADTARAALGWLDIPGCPVRENGWNLLRGSDDPLPRSVEEAHRLLTEPDHSPTGAPAGPPPESTPAPLSANRPRMP